MVSPDGRLVAFLRQPPDQAQRTQLWVYDPGENQPRMISDRFQNPGVFMTPLEPTAVNVAWAADSSELYFVEKDDPLSAHSRLAALRSGRPRGTTVPLLEVPETIQDVRPARTRPEIAFVRRSAAPNGRVRFGLSVLDMKTRQVRQIHGGESAAKGADVRLLGWSADGSRLVFLEVTPNDNQTNRVVVRGVSIADGTLWPVGTLQRAYTCTARLDPSGRSVFIVRRDKGANVLMTLAVVGGVVSDRHNTGRESIVLEGITFTTSDEVVFARHEQAREDLGHFAGSAKVAVHQRRPDMSVNPFKPDAVAVNPLELEALRHLLRRLEILVFEAYFSKRGNYMDIARALDAGCTLMRRMEMDPDKRGDPDECPWVRCGDSSCRPVCSPD